MKSKINSRNNSRCDNNKTHNQNANIDCAVLCGPCDFRKLVPAVYEVLNNTIVMHINIVKNPWRSVVNYIIFPFSARDFSGIIIRLKNKASMKINKKILVEMLIFLPALALVIKIAPQAATVFGQYIPIPEKLCGEGSFPCPEGATGIQMARSLTAKIIDNVRYVIGAVAVLMLVVSGIRLIFAGGNEEVFKKQETNLKFTIIGLFFVGLAGELAQIFDVGGRGFLDDPNVMLKRSRLFNRTVEITITFIKYIVGSVSVLFIVRSGLRMVLMGGNEEEAGKDKKNIFYGLLGLIVILISNPIINKVFFKIDTSKYPGLEGVRPGVDVKRLIGEITGITNIVAAIAGPLALLSLVAGGLMYILAGGEDEKINKAKKVITWAIIGLIIIYGSFAIVSTFVSRQFEGL